MNKCGKCGNQMKEQTKFCKSCGSDLSGSAASLNDKKARVMSQDRTWVKPAVIASVVVLVVVGGLLFRDFRAKRMGNNPQFAPHRDASTRTTNAVPVTEQSGDVKIPMANVQDGNAHFYSYAAGGKTVTFFVMKAVDGSIRTAFDACVACNHAKLGYRQEGGLVVCNNCGMGFTPAQIGQVTGGCNPIPVNKTLDGQMLVLKAKDLESGAQYF
jgi:uncharacterized membrane protein